MKYLQMKRFRALILLLVATAARAGDGPEGSAPPPPLPEPVAVADLLAHAYERNPDIRAARAAWGAAIEGYRISTAYPDPQLMGTYFPEPIETRMGPQDWNLTVSQMIPFPGKLSKAGDVARAEAEIARVQLDKAVRDMVVGIRRSYWELAYIRRARRIARLNMDLVDQLRKEGETAHAEDRATLSDVVKGQSQVGRLRYDLLLLEELEATELARLNGLLNRPPDAPVGDLVESPVRDLVYDIGEIQALAEANREEIRMAALTADKADRQAELARYGSLPDFKVGLFYAAIGDPEVMTPPPDAGRDAVGVRMGVNIPLWFGKNNARIARAQAAAEKARAEREARVIDTRTGIREVFFRLRNARRLITLYAEDLLPQAEASMALSEIFFQENGSGFTDLLEAQGVLYNFQLSLARARADYGKALARLEQLVGRSLTERTGRGIETEPEETP